MNKKSIEAQSGPAQKNEKLFPEGHNFSNVLFMKFP